MRKALIILKISYERNSSRIARDEDGMLYLYLREPQKVTGQWSAPDLHIGYIKLGDTVFPEVQWSDKEPTKVKITIEK